MKQENTIESKGSGRPFLRWAGGKSWFLPEISNYIPHQGFNNYVEPFLGGGAIFFHLKPDKAFLSDLNPELTDTYNIIKESVHAVIKEMRRYENTKDFYYKLRAKKFRNPVKKAARFIYLNQTSFNGIYRVNLKGQYNVPYGFRKKDFLDPDTLISASEILQSAEIKCQDFGESLSKIGKKDLVFIDPPYTVTHNNNGFIKYNANLFDLDAQYRLSEFIDQIKKIGAYYILTNAAHWEIKKIFKKEGDNIIKVSRLSRVGGKLAKRGVYEELVFTNVK